MALGGTDLNLLVALKVLLEEGNVTRAGSRLQLGQPAMSGALGKLRRKFDDELLIRNGRSYELTPFARELLPDVQEAVRLMSRALQADEAFDPEAGRHTFRLAMSDYAIAILHEPLLAQVTRHGPSVRLRVDHLTPGMHHSDRAVVDYDVFVAPMGFSFAGISRPLWKDRMVCLVSAESPYGRDHDLTVAELSAMPHAVVSFGRGTMTPVDRVLSEVGVDRRTQVQVPSWLPLPFVIEGSAMVAIVPERLARIHDRPGGPLRVLELPFADVPLVEGYWFAPDRQGDVPLQWLLARLDEVGAVLGALDPVQVGT